MSIPYRSDVIPESHGTTVSVNVDHYGSATSLRVGITVVHNLLPTILQLCRREKRPAIRCLLEQIKFVLRLVLLGSYWYQLSCDDNLDSAGLLMNGGMYWPHEQVGVTVEEEQGLRQRQAYVGRRTGRTVVKHPQRSSSTTAQRSTWTLLAGELLHIYRPLHWAHVERRRGTPSLTEWLSTMGMDVLSLLMLQSHEHSTLNNNELRRRKFKLLLYLLRGPIFDKYTEPVTSAVFNGFGKIPLFGSLLERYLWDWLAYWKHPFASESD